MKYRLAFFLRQEWVVVSKVEHQRISTLDIDFLKKTCERLGFGPLEKCVRNDTAYYRTGWIERKFDALLSRVVNQLVLLPYVGEICIEATTD